MVGRAAGSVSLGVKGYGEEEEGKGLTGGPVGT